MTINIYRWDDASAPQLRGVVGDLTTLLDAILVNGYGSKAAAGWAIAFTGTNTRAYRPASGNRMYLAVDDTNPAPASLGANFARLSSYETMTTSIAGTNRIPTAQQIILSPITGIGVAMMKSGSADTTQRPWIAYVSDTFIHFHSYVSVSTTAGVANALNSAAIGSFMWGDLVNQQKAGDAYATVLIGGFNVSPSNSSQCGILAANTSSNLSAHFMQRAYHQANYGIGMAKSAVARGISLPSTIGEDASAPNFPDPITGGIELAEVWVYEATGGNSIFSARGRIPGLYNPLHNPLSMAASFQVGDTITGSGTYAGQTFQFCCPGPTTVALMQTSGTW